MKLASLIGAVTIGLATVAGAAVNYKSPVAVLPFKNLNADASTDWLKLGIAETMLTDLKKAKVNVVERDQIDKALGEMLLRNQTASSEDGEAVAIGKLVGAKTVVVGSFQAAGKQLRFNARFVEVETGVILDSAKTTGPMDQVFSLQDQVVDKLLGAETAKAARPARKQGAKTVEAYKLYAMSLATASDAERVGLLRKSIALDPSFVYAAEELAALEKRLAEYAKTRLSATAKQDEIVLALLEDPKVAPEEKQWRASQFLNRHLAERKCRQTIGEAERILSMNIPDPPSSVTGAGEFALYALFECHARMNQPDLALQAGERLLARYPSGGWYVSVERGMKSIIEAKKSAPKRRQDVDAKLAENDARRAVTEAELAKRRARLAEIDAQLPAMKEGTEKTLLEGQRAGEDFHIQRLEVLLFGQLFERCTIPLFDDNERTLENCRRVVERYKGSTKSWEVPRVLQAESFTIKTLGKLGRWEEAIPAARAFIAAHPEPEAQSEVRDIQGLLDSTWPSDVVP